MATDERNFRSSYYEKVGFRSVEEKKSLEILLKDKPLDKIKIKQFCLRFSVPGGYRIEVWKLLFGITPIYLNNHDFIMLQRKKVYDDLLESLQVMRLINDSTSKPQLFLIMWLLETGQLKFDIKLQLDDVKYKSFISISESLLEMCDSNVDTYWMSKGYYDTVGQFYHHIPKLVDSVRVILEKEDKLLFKRLCDIDMFQLVRVDRWLMCLFAGILTECALEKIWDKVIGGSYKVLAFAAVQIFTSLRWNIFNSSITELMEELNNIPEETCELIGNKTIDLWQQYGSPLIIDEIKREKVEVSS